MVMLIILIFCVANMLYIFNKKRGSDYEKYEDWNDKDVVNKLIFTENLQSNAMSSIIYAYMLSLGDYKTIDFAGDNDWFLWGIFIMATFLL